MQMFYINISEDQMKNDVKVDSTQNSTRNNSDTSVNKHEIKNRRKSLGPNITQLRRSPRKKVSTASIVSRNTFRSSAQKPVINIAAGDAESIYSGDTNSIISNRRSLPGSTYHSSKKEKEHDKPYVDERGDSRATRSGRTLGTEAYVANENKVNKSTVPTGANSEDNFKQKLRNAVYDALKEKNICEDNKVILNDHVNNFCLILYFNIALHKF